MNPSKKIRIYLGVLGEDIKKDAVNSVGMFKKPSKIMEIAIVVIIVAIMTKKRGVMAIASFIYLILYLYNIYIGGDYQRKIKEERMEELLPKETE